VAIPVIGLSLGGCGAGQVERALRPEPGVLYVYVNRATETAYVRYDPDRIGHQRLRRGIEALGLRAGSPRTWH
jgi:Cu+-exporting ATPase